MNQPGQYYQQPPAAAYPPAPAYAAPTRPVGKVRDSTVVVLLSFFTFGFYSMYYHYSLFDELHRWRGQGWSGGTYLLFLFICGLPLIAMPWLLPSYVGAMFVEDGQQAPVSGMTGCWIFIPILGAIIWIYRVQGAFNTFWRGKGATG